MKKVLSAIIVGLVFISPVEAMNSGKAYMMHGMLNTRFQQGAVEEGVIVVQGEPQAQSAQPVQAQAPAARTALAGFFSNLSLVGVIEAGVMVAAGTSIVAAASALTGSLIYGSMVDNPAAKPHAGYTAVFAGSFTGFLANYALVTARGKSMNLGNIAMAVSVGAISSWIATNAWDNL